MIILIIAEKYFEEIQHDFIIKVLKVGTEEHTQHNKDYVQWGDCSLL